MSQELNTSSKIPLFSEKHAKLFSLFRQHGWHEMKASPESAHGDWELAHKYFWINDAAMDIQIELGGIKINKSEVVKSSLLFSPEKHIKYMARIDDFQVDIHKILGTQHEVTPSGFPVASVNGSVLFVLENYKAALIDHSLCGFFRAPNPFIILDWVLLGIASPLLEHHETHRGDYIANYLDDHGRLVKPLT